MPEAWEPSPAEVKRRMPQRLAGEEFSDTTNPSKTAVEEMVGDVATDISTHVGEDIPEEHHELARLAAAYGTAADIEATFWPEENPTGESDTSYAYFRARYDELLKRLVTLVGDTVSSEAATTGAPKGHFPTPAGDTDEILTPLGTKRF